MAWHRGISIKFQKQIEDNQKQNRLSAPMTSRDEFIERLEELRDDLANILIEFRPYMARLYGIESLIDRAEVLETNIQGLQASFNKSFNVEEVKADVKPAHEHSFNDIGNCECGAHEDILY